MDAYCAILTEKHQVVQANVTDTGLPAVETMLIVPLLQQSSHQVDWQVAHSFF